MKNTLKHSCKKGMTRREKIRINLIADFFIVISVFYVDILLVKILLVVLALYKHYYFIKKIKTIDRNGTEKERFEPSNKGVASAALFLMVLKK